MTLELTGITVDYGDHRAVDDLSVTVADGTVFALVGPSGCGKSTLLRAIAGLVPLTAGAMRWEHEDLLAVPTERRDIGFMFQDHALFTHRNVADNVSFGLRMRKVESVERDRRVTELLAMVGLEGFGDRSVESLSGGEAQRVALARALAPEPRLLLLDEPLASLDRARRNELNEELTGLLRELAQTALYVTHDQHEAFAIADRVGVMVAGRLVRTGTPAEVWQDPQSEFVAQFLGHGTVIERNGLRVAVRDDAVQFGDPTPGANDPIGEVLSSRFQGDRHRITVAGDDGTEWTGWSIGPLDVGQRVAVHIDDDRLAPLDD